MEITEHARVEDYDLLAKALEGPRRAGLRLAVDDAGAGYASLQHILRLAPDAIKLDMALTRNVQVDARRRALVAALVPFAAEIDATVVAEGIETEDELAALRGFGATWGQGYLLGRPGPLPGVREPSPDPNRGRDAAVSTAHAPFDEQTSRDVAAYWAVHRSALDTAREAVVEELRAGPELAAVIDRAVQDRRSEGEMNALLEQAVEQGEWSRWIERLQQQGAP